MNYKLTAGCKAWIGAIYMARVVKKESLRKMVNKKIWRAHKKLRALQRFDNYNYNNLMLPVNSCGSRFGKISGCPSFAVFQPARLSSTFIFSFKVQRSKFAG